MQRPHPRDGVERSLWRRVASTRVASLNNSDDCFQDRLHPKTNGRARVTTSLTLALALAELDVRRNESRCDATRDEPSRCEQARQDSNLQPPVLEPTPSNAGLTPFVDFQRLSSGPATPALLDNAGVGTIPGTEKGGSSGGSAI